MTTIQKYKFIKGTLLVRSLNNSAGELTNTAPTKISNSIVKTSIILLVRSPKYVPIISGSDAPPFLNEIIPLM